MTTAWAGGQWDGKEGRADGRLHVGPREREECGVYPVSYVVTGESPQVPAELPVSLKRDSLGVLWVWRESWARDGDLGAVGLHVTEARRW